VVVVLADPVQPVKSRATEVMVSLVRSQVRQFFTLVVAAAGEPAVGQGTVASVAVAQRV
jgi:hypothetical protein